MNELFGPLQHVELSSGLSLIVFLPALGALVNALAGVFLQRKRWAASISDRLHTGSFAISAVAVGVMGAAFVLAIRYAFVTCTATCGR
jgi:NADH-quinone oxidoreductase subunit L